MNLLKIRFEKAKKELDDFKDKHKVGIFVHITPENMGEFEHLQNTYDDLRIELLKQKQNDFTDKKRR